MTNDHDDDPVGLCDAPDTTENSDPGHWDAPESRRETAANGEDELSKRHVNERSVESAPPTVPDSVPNQTSGKPSDSSDAVRSSSPPTRQLKSDTESGDTAELRDTVETTSNPFGEALDAAGEDDEHRFNQTLESPRDPRIRKTLAQENGESPADFNRTLQSPRSTPLRVQFEVAGSDLDDREPPPSGPVAPLSGAQPAVVRECLTQARAAQMDWSQGLISERIKALRKVKKQILSRAEEIALVIAEECG